MNGVNDVFTAAYNKCETIIPFDIKWSNGCGYFDFAVYGENAPKLGNGEVVKSFTPGKRRILIIGTRLGNVCIFDRHSEQQLNEKNYNTGTFVYNANEKFKMCGWYSGNFIDEYEMSILVGDENIGNAGWRLEQLFSAMRKAA
jgi:hypothetical protein